MNNVNSGWKSATEKSSPHQLSTRPQPYASHQNAAYVDAMLNFATGPQGEPYIVKKQAHLHAGLNSFLCEAIPRDNQQLHALANIELPADSPLWRHIDMLDGYLQIFSSDFIQNPARSVFYRVMSRSKFRRGPWSVFNRQAISTIDGHKKRNHFFVMLIDELRREALRINIEKKMNAWEYPTDSNTRRVDEYISYLFNRCDNLSVIELIALHPQSAVVDLVNAVERKAALEHQQMTDLQFLLAGDKTPEEENDSPPAIPSLPREVLGRDLRRIFDNLGNKKSISRFKIGHASSIEWSQLIGHYARLLFFFDGANVGDPEMHAETLRDYFARMEGEVTFINCNKAPDHYPETGLISADDFSRRELLHRRLQFWGQKEQFMRIRASQGLRSFRTGDIPAAWRNGG